ncbi:MAG: class I SAM-dependent methyltransferase [Thermoguttaceae bacterium]
MKNRLSECRTFLREYARHGRSTGAVLPSGRSLARALSRYVRNAPSPQQILEVGPGTGAVTSHIVARMGPDDRLDLVELNDTFVHRLRQRLANEPAFQAVADRTRIYHCPIEDLAAQPSYDVIVSGLPFNNFTPPEVEKILGTLHGLLRPAGTLSFFEYIAIRFARMVVSRRAERHRLRGVGMALRKVLGPYEIRCEWIWPNVPPAWVHHVRFEQTKGKENAL